MSSQCVLNRVEVIRRHVCKAQTESQIRSSAANDLRSMLSRPRRNRRTPVIRESQTETWLAPCHFVYPLFIHDGEKDFPVASMPGCSRLSLDGLMREVQGAISDGIGMIEIFPAVSVNLKTPGSEEAWNPNGLVQTAIRRLKARWPELMVVTDVALDPYNSDGHDGVVDEEGIYVLFQTQQVLNRKCRTI